MPSHSQEPHTINGAEPDDQLGQWIRRGLEDAVGGQGPGDEVWARIRQRLEQKDLPAASASAPRGLSSPLAQLLQAVVVSTLLLTFVFGAHHSPVVPRLAEHGAGTTPVVRRAPAPELSEADTLRGYILVRMEKQSQAHRGGDVRGTRAPE